MDNYSVLMPLYKNDKPEWFQYSLDSILNQTILANEIVIVCDGPLTRELEKKLSEYTSKDNSLIKIFRFQKNVGLGIALAKGIELCTNELIARMDADDFAAPERCEKQLRVFYDNPEIDVVGSNVKEFTENIDNVVSYVHLPEYQNQIIAYAKKRCPIRHPALMYRKEAVLKAGNYRDYRHAQDYNLIVHMLLTDAKIYNIQEDLMYMRVSSDFYKRRGGWKQIKLILRMKKEFYKYNFYTRSDYIISAWGNVVICLMPNNLRKLFYKKILRR